MKPRLSVIVPAHNPREDYLGRVLEALRKQTLAMAEWELLLVDNASTPALRERFDLSWHPRAAHVTERKLGLTAARLRGLAESRAEILILVDDDNILAPDYLATALDVAAEYPFLGTWGGCIQPEYERPDFALPLVLHPLLTLRDATADLWSNDPDHHASTPWGAGLCIRRVVADTYIRELSDNAARNSLDLHGGKLLYGGDTDIGYTGCRLGLGKGVFRKLHLTHMIPASRCTVAHLCRVSEGRGYSEILHGYALSGKIPEPEEISFFMLLKRLRLLFKPALERSVAIAHLRGRSRALHDLSNMSVRE